LTILNTIFIAQDHIESERTYAIMVSSVCPFVHHTDQATRTVLSQRNRAMPLLILIVMECTGRCFRLIIEADDMVALTC